jgi:hypothetical protein
MAWLGLLNNSSQYDLMLPPITIRSAVSADAIAIADLLDQLGYPATPEEAATQLASLQEFPCKMVSVDGSAKQLSPGPGIRVLREFPLPRASIAMVRTRSMKE